MWLGPVLPGESARDGEPADHQPALVCGGGPAPLRSLGLHKLLRLLGGAWDRVRELRSASSSPLEFPLTNIWAVDAFYYER